VKFVYQSKEDKDESSAVCVTYEAQQLQPTVTYSLSLLYP